MILNTLVQMRTIYFERNFATIISPLRVDLPSKRNEIRAKAFYSAAIGRITLIVSIIRVQRVATIIQYDKVCDVISHRYPETLPFYPIPADCAAR